MRVNFGGGRSLARSRTKANISARAKYLKSTKSSRSSVSSRLSSVRKNTAANSSISNKMSSSVKADLFSDVESAAKGLQKDLNVLMQTGDKSVFVSSDTEKAKETTDAAKEDKIAVSYEDSIKSFVRHYNAMIDAMSDLGDTTNMVYLANMKSDMSAQSKALGKVGVTVNKDGSLKLDEKALKEADMKQVENLFGSKGSISTKIVKYAASIEKSATQTLKSLNTTNSTSLNSGYNRYGRSVNNYYNSKYNYSG